MNAAEAFLTLGYVIPLLYVILYNLFRGVLPLLFENVPHINDINFHQSLATRIYETGSIDAWVPQWGSGAAVLRYYQNLPHIVAAVMAYLLPLSPGTAIVVLNAFFLAALPWGVFWCMRKLGFDPFAASFASFLTLFIEADRKQKHLFGLMHRCFTWDGWGLFTLVVGSFWLCIAWALVGKWVTTGRGYFAATLTLSFTWLSHLSTGYGASVLAFTFLLQPGGWSRAGVGRVIVLQLGVAIAVSYLLLPTALEGPFQNRSPFEPSEYWDSYGLARSLRWLLKGWLFDNRSEQMGEIPWFTILVFLAFVFLLARVVYSIFWNREILESLETVRLLGLATAFAGGFLLFSGRHTFGVFVELLPLSANFAFHRFFVLVHFFGVMLAGWALNVFYCLLQRGVALLVRSDKAASVVLAVCLLLVIIPMAGQHATQVRDHIEHLKMQVDDLVSPWGLGIQTMLDLVKNLTDIAPGRAYGGARWNWGYTFDVKYLKIYAMWTSQGRMIPNIGFMWHAIGPMSDMDFFFNESRPDHRRLYNVRYVLCSLGSAPQPATVVGDVVAHHAVHIWEDAEGYFSFIIVDGCYEAFRAKHRDEVGSFRENFILGGQHKDYVHPRIALTESDACVDNELFPKVLPRGIISDPTGNLDVFAVTVNCQEHQGCAVMLRVTYHPNFLVRSNSSQLILRTFCVAPSYIGFVVPHGTHRIVAEWTVPWTTKALQVLSFSWMGVCLLLALLWRRDGDDAAASSVIKKEDDKKESASKEKNGTALEGFIQAGGRDFGIRVLLPANPASRAAAGVASKRHKSSTSTLRFEFSPELAEVLQGFEGAATKKAAQARDVGEAMVELRDLVERVLKGQRASVVTSSASSSSMPGASYYQRLVPELEAMKVAGALVGVNADLDEIKLQTRDAAGRTHCVTVSLPTDYPQSPPVCYADLPEPLSLCGWDASSSSLKQVLQSLEAAALQYGPFWDALEALDRATWVLEPENPSRSSCLRRVAIAPHCSVQMHIDPRAPFHIPKLRFLGAAKMVQPLVDALNVNAKEWNPSLPLVINLERVLRVKLPSAATSKREDFLDDHCAICYEYRLAESTPDVVCSNARCSKAFHRTCLYDWLRAIPTTKHSFSSVFGACPFCETAVVVQIGKG